MSDGHLCRIDTKCNLCHYWSMKTLTLKELHQSTGKYARMAMREPMMVTDRGQPIATLGPPLYASESRPLPRSFVWEDAIDPQGGTESGETVSEMRDER